MIMIIATFGQALSGQAPAVGIIGVLIVWRFIVRFFITFSLHLLPHPYLVRWVWASEVTIL